MKKEPMSKMYWKKGKLKPLYFIEVRNTAGTGKISTRGATSKGPL